MMKKFLGKLFLACLPLILFAALFAAYEPYNYWGLKAEKSGNWITPLARVRAFMREPSEHIILGDSRMLHFDMDQIEEITGVRYANLSTGGQKHNLTREMYEWAKTKADLQSVVVDMSFWQVRTGMESASAQPVFYIAEHPLVYMTTRDYVIEAAKLMLQDLSGPEAPSATPVEKTEKDPSEGKYRQDLVDYALNAFWFECENYSIGEEQMENFIYILDDCREHGVEPTVVLPPMQESIWELVIHPLELEPYLEEYKRRLSAHADLYDMEWESSFSLEQDIFADGVHFRNGDGYSRFTQAIFTGEADFLRIYPRNSLVQ